MTLNELLELKYTDAEKYELALDEYMEDEVDLIIPASEATEEQLAQIADEHDKFEESERRRIYGK
tara:strand:- start:357 stop:551 length:195 start_codon:yes stop_codon:yes gene_type:complete